MLLGAGMAASIRTHQQEKSRGTKKQARSPNLGRMSRLLKASRAARRPMMTTTLKETGRRHR